LTYPELKIRVPIVYADFSDAFKAKDNGKVSLERRIVDDYEERAESGNYLQHPIQKLLKDGVVRLPFSAFPGELGNSYIVGHSSNFQSIDSAYNEVFKPLQNAQKGQTFTVYDHRGRKLEFEVFEITEIEAEDTDTAYKFFEGRRVVTLQASVLERVGGQLKPTKRILVRGELVR
jgi:sortase (surface protein transpeptidase)